MTAYYIDCPRNFANEYQVLAVTPEIAEAFAETFPNAERISRAEAIRLGWTRPRQARKDGEQWFGGFAGPGGAMNLAEALELAKVATAQQLDHAHMMLAGY